MKIEKGWNELRKGEVGVEGEWRKGEDELRLRIPYEICEWLRKVDDESRTKME